jgi:hypothetical protein
MKVTMMLVPVNERRLIETLELVDKVSSLLFVCLFVCLLFIVYCLLFIVYCLLLLSLFQMMLSTETVFKVPTFGVFLKFIENFLSQNDIDCSLKVKLILERWKKKCGASYSSVHQFEEEEEETTSFNVDKADIGRVVVEDYHSDDVVSLKSWCADGDSDGDEEKEGNEEYTHSKHIHSAKPEETCADFHSPSTSLHVSSAATTAVLSPSTISKIFMSSLNRLRAEKEKDLMNKPFCDEDSEGEDEERIEDIEVDDLLDFISHHHNIHCSSETSLSSPMVTSLLSSNPVLLEQHKVVDEEERVLNDQEIKGHQPRLEEMKWSHLSLLVEFFKRNIPTGFSSSSSSSSYVNPQYYYYQQKCNLILYHYHCYCGGKKTKKQQLRNKMSCDSEGRNENEMLETNSTRTIDEENTNQRSQILKLKDESQNLDRLQFLLGQCYILLSPFCAKDSSKKSSSSSSSITVNDDAKQQNLFMIWACIEQLYQL